MNMQTFIQKHKPLKDEPFPFTEDQRAFIDELKTTGKPQDRGYLRTNHGYCCLGIACELFKMTSETFRRNYADEDGKPLTIHRFGDEHHHLPLRLTYRLRLRSKAANFKNDIYIDGQKFPSLVALNDHISLDSALASAYTFKDIASYIEHDPWNVFLWPDESYEEGVPFC